MAGMTATPRIVLVVDDEPDILIVLEKALSRAGYSVLLALGPLQAIEQSRSLGGEINLLLTDVVMPEMDGIELARLLASERPGLRVLLMSGYSRTRSNLPFLAKPFQVEELLRRVSNALDGPAAFDQDGQADEETASQGSSAGS
jgi:two-component system, cell cycle sensor histidine kinase and response regulator CckA